MWQRIKSFFKDSETIAYAWFSMAAGSLVTVISFVDPALIEPFLTPQTFAIYVLLNGLATKWLRERRADDLRPRADDPDWDV